MAQISAVGTGTWWSLILKQYVMGPASCASARKAQSGWLIHCRKTKVLERARVEERSRSVRLSRGEITEPTIGGPSCCSKTGFKRGN